MRAWWSVGVAALLVSGAGWAAAQMNMTPRMNMGPQQQSLGANQSVMAAILSPVTGEPYQAEKLTRSTQTLSDGTVITHETRGLIARDAAGRVREDLYIVHSGQVNGKEVDKSLQSATVGDPVAHRMLFWTGTGGKIAMEMPLPSLPAILTAPPPPPPPRPMGTEDTPPRAISLGSRSAASKDTVRTESLGRQSLAGVMVDGTRVTTTIPLGEVGNDRPIEVVHEEWSSPQLGIVVKTVDTDPRTGEQTMELNALEQVEPSETLFQAPAGYTVQDFANMMKAFGDLGKSGAK